MAQRAKRHGRGMRGVLVLLPASARLPVPGGRRNSTSPSRRADRQGPSDGV